MTDKFEVVRTIHPVGQGAFYSEMFFDEDHNKQNTVVFDCGSKTQIKGGLSKVVNGAFDDCQDIDLLFISHFDEDHVNGIKYILSHKRQIKYVVIPQLDKYEWFYVIEKAYHLSQGEGDEEELSATSDLIYGLHERLSISGAEIVQVKPITEGDEAIYAEGRANRFNNDDEREQYDDITNVIQPGGVIDSGTVFGLKKKPLWIYMPFNYTYQADVNALKIKIDMVLASDQKFGKKDLTELTSAEICDFIKRNRKAINDAYNNVFPDTNSSSLCVYSGAVPFVESEINPYNCLYNIDYFRRYCRRHGYRYFGYQTEGCLYTGDSMLKGRKHLPKLKFILNRVIPFGNRLGMFQVPHHGSKANLNEEGIEEILKSTQFPQLLCFASYGNNNSFGHPSDALVSKLLSFNEVCFHGVTESKDTALRVRIECED